jgi:ribosomal protein S13
MQENSLHGIKGIAIASARVIVEKLGTKAQKDKIKALKEEGKEEELNNLKTLTSIMFNIGKQAS